jgi:hypothetical protein
VARYRHATLSQIELGPLLPDLMRVGARTGSGCRHPSLALVGKALAQVPLARRRARDPSSTRSSLVGGASWAGACWPSFGPARPTARRRVLYEAQKLRLRAVAGDRGGRAA